jgi:quinolinate synthase
MKVTTLPKVRDALVRNQYRITVPPDVARRARKAIERMVAIGGRGGVGVSPAPVDFDPGE